MTKRLHTPIRKQQAGWEQYVRMTAAPSTYRRYTAVVERFLTHHSRRYTTPLSFHRCVLEDWKTLRMEKGVSRFSVMTEVVAIKYFFRWQTHMGVLMANPFGLARGVPLPKVKRVTTTKLIRELMPSPNWRAHK